MRAKGKYDKWTSFSSRMWRLEKSFNSNLREVGPRCRRPPDCALSVNSWPFQQHSNETLQGPSSYLWHVRETELVSDVLVAVDGWRSVFDSFRWNRKNTIETKGVNNTSRVIPTRRPVRMWLCNPILTQIMKPWTKLHSTVQLARQTAIAIFHRHKYLCNELKWYKLYI